MNIFVEYPRQAKILLESHGTGKIWQHQIFNSGAARIKAIWLHKTKQPIYSHISGHHGGWSCFYNLCNFTNVFATMFSLRAAVCSYITWKYSGIPSRCFYGTLSFYTDKFQPLAMFPLEGAMEGASNHFITSPRMKFLKSQILYSPIVQPQLTLQVWL